MGTVDGPKLKESSPGLLLGGDCATADHFAAEFVAGGHAPRYRPGGVETGHVGFDPYPIHEYGRVGHDDTSYRRHE